MADRIGEADVTDDPIAEEGVRTSFGQVDELIRNHHVAWMDRFFHRSDSADHNDPLNAQYFHPIDIRPVVEKRGLDSMALSVSWQKGDFHPFETTHDV